MAADHVDEQGHGQAEDHRAVGVFAEQVGQRDRGDDPQDLDRKTAQPEQSDRTGQDERDRERVQRASPRLAVRGAERAADLDDSQRQRSGHCGQSPAVRVLGRVVHPGTVGEATSDLIACAVQSRLLPVAYGEVTCGADQS
jgi:hypothetical protein